VDHRLVVVYNGFGPGDDLGRWEHVLEGVAYEAVRLRAPVLDLDAYSEAVQRVPAECFCFLNSYSVLLADGWLRSLIDAASQAGVGLAGASGSWASRSSHMRFGMRLGGPYAGLLGDPADSGRMFRALATPGERRAGLASRISTAIEVPRTLAGFPSFPAHHLRTNGFVVRREVWKAIVGEGTRVRSKLDAHLLESGRRSLSRRAEAASLAVAVVGRDGRVYPHPQWAASNTFWRGGQENLLIADNQTEAYARADEATRAALSRYAWGDAACSPTGTANA